jgi:hypothetical protein
MAYSTTRRATLAHEAMLSFSLQKGGPECERVPPFPIEHKRALSDGPEGLQAPSFSVFSE